MPVRPPDFKSSGVRVERIIASGSSKNPRLLIIGSGSTQSDGINVNTDTLRLSGTGSDTWLFISGSTGTTDRITLGGNTFISGTIFGLDLKLSGSSTSIQANSVHGGSDVNFYVDGIAGSKDTTTRGTSVFDGDMVVSGVIRDGSGVAYYPGASTGPDGVLGDLQFNDGVGGFGASSTLNFDIGTDTLSLTRLVANSAISGSLTQLPDGSSYLIEGSNITILSNSNGSVTISSAGGGGSSNWNELSPSPRLNTTASVSIAGGLGSSYAAESKGSDVFFFVSGTKGGTTSSTKKSVFGGDLKVSGVLSFEDGIISGSGDVNFYFGRPGHTAELYIRDADSLPAHPVAIFSGHGATYSLELSGGLYVNAQNDINAEMVVEDRDGNVLAHFDMYNRRTFLSGTQVTINKMSAHGGSDVNFFVSGTAGSRGSSTRGTSVFSGDVVVTGSTYFGTSNSDTFVMNSRLGSSIVPTADRIHDLGSPTLRFANMYTGDLHLKNDRGDWTIIEELDFLSITNNRTGKRYKFLMEPID